MKEKEDKSNENHGCFVLSAIGALILIGLTKLIRPQTIPFDFLHFWKINGSLLEAIKLSWIIFAWGILINVVVLVFSQRKPSYKDDAEVNLGIGFLISIWAGVMEEICFRWLLFYGVIVSLQIVNWMFFGCLGFGIAEWFYSYFLIPIANFTTLGYLEPILIDKYGWAVGAALISVNGRFRDAHAYQGIFGIINSWFLGMFFFYLMFNYGLIPAIFVHFLYDMLIFATHYVDAIITRVKAMTRKRA